MRSMTGFGRERIVAGGKEYLVEIRSVNSRYCELTAKVPKNYTYLEEKLKTLVKSRLSRGKAEISLTVYDIQGRDTAITVNTLVVKRYLEEMRKCSKELGLKDDIELSDIFRMTDAFTVVRPEEDEDVIWANAESAAKGALDKFTAMRETEGEKLKADILEKLAGIERMTEEVERLSPETVKAYRERLYTRLKEVLENVQADEQRIIAEAAIFADKTAVDEETIRLHSHFKQFREMTEAKEPVGRKLDFLVQEINRESNTIGSKCQDLRVTKLVIEMKSEIEKIREQIQNIE